ncbi:MAG TPA: hypothetical protein VLK85_10970 [Ramlibacter sp.]|nr:hypothetical protein [Ramlibacter sp.]
MRVLAALGLALASLAAHGQAQLEARDDAVIFRGRIDGASAEAFRRLLQDPRITRLVITSSGGLVAPALDMAEAIHARGLDVEVPSACLSSCANYVFPAGRRKRLGHPLAVGWHGNMAHVLYLQRAGLATWPEPQLASARLLAQREAELYRRLGVDGFLCWFGKIAPYDAPEFYTLSVADMARFGVRDVEVLVERPPEGDLPRLLAVDWQRLEADRPPMRLVP